MKDMRMLLITILLLNEAYSTEGFSTFKEKIPNGHHVPNPCTPGAVWEGVGHTNVFGKGPRNPFGTDFGNMGKTWSKQLCKLDSDGDGRTNGEELGDPCCEWTAGNTTVVSVDKLSHPGICEPLDNKVCKEKNAWLRCQKTTGFNCDGVTNADVSTFTVRVTNESVPAKETNYLCKVFDIPVTTTNDIIAAELIIGNREVLHHMILYGCNENDKTADSSDDMFECFMNTGCRGMISAFAAWDPSINAFCLPPDVGVRINAGGYKKLLIQYHWTNFGLKKDLIDNSGLKLYITPKLRPNLAGMLMVGQIHIEIPPGRECVSVSGGCVSDCSRHRIKKPVKVIETFHHMHYLGKEQILEVFRNGTKALTLSHEKNYDYNNPKFYRFGTPVELSPGDYIRTTCMYNSMKQNSLVKFGIGTKDEMCFAFLRYYPLENLPLDEGGCSQYKSVPLCKIYTAKSYTIDGCNINNLLNSSNDELQNIIGKVRNKCRFANNTIVCTPECRTSVEEISKHPCFMNDIGDFFIERILFEALKTYFDREGAKILVGALKTCRTMRRNQITVDPNCRQEGTATSGYVDIWATTVSLNGNVVMRCSRAIVFVIVAFLLCT